MEMNKEEIEKGSIAILKLAFLLWKDKKYLPQKVSVFHQFPIGFFSIVPEKYRNEDWLFFRESGSHFSLIFNHKTDEIVFLTLDNPEAVKYLLEGKFPEGCWDSLEKEVKWFKKWRKQNE